MPIRSVTSVANDSVTTHSVVEAESGDTVYSGTLEHCIVFIQGYDAGSPTYVDLRVLDESGIPIDYHETAGSLKDTCWEGYEAVGLKKKNGRTVPNCVPNLGLRSK